MGAMENQTADYSVNQQSTFGQHVDGGDSAGAGERVAEGTLTGTLKVLASLQDPKGGARIAVELERLEKGRRK